MPQFPLCAEELWHIWCRHGSWVTPRSRQAGSRMLLHPNMSVVTYIHMPLSPPPRTLNMKYVFSILQNVINKCLHLVLCPPFLLCFFPHFSHELSYIPFHKFIFFIYLLLLCSFISFSPRLLHFHPLSQFLLLPGLHATKEDKVVSIFFCVLSLLWMWCLCCLKVKERWLGSNLKLRCLLSVYSMLTATL